MLMMEFGGGGLSLFSSSLGFLFDSWFMFAVHYPLDFIFQVFHFSVFLWEFPIPLSLLKSFFGQFTDFISLGSVPGSLAFFGD